jgi:hypothetical protein
MAATQSSDGLTTAHQPQRLMITPCAVGCKRRLDRLPSTLPATLPMRRMLPTVNRQHDNRTSSHAEVDRVGKATQHGSLRRAMHTRKRRGHFGDPLHESLEGFTELVAKTSATRLVPLLDLDRLSSGLWPEDNLERHVQPRSLERTTDHGTPLSGSLRCSAQRRSSSARSASLNSRCSSRSSSSRLSHRDMAKSARSPGESFKSSVNGFEGMGDRRMMAVSLQSGGDGTRSMGSAAARPPV